jgi:hypothetical protein
VDLSLAQIKSTKNKNKHRLHLQGRGINEAKIKREGIRQVFSTQQSAISHNIELLMPIGTGRYISQYRVVDTCRNWALYLTTELLMPTGTGLSLYRTT